MTNDKMAIQRRFNVSDWNFNLNTVQCFIIPVGLTAFLNKSDYIVTCLLCSYLTTTEWSSFYGGKKNTVEVGDKAKFRRMPFFCCRWQFFG